MIRLLPYLLGQKVATSTDLCPPLDDACIGLPKLTDSKCKGSECNACADVCPTSAIEILPDKQSASVRLDLGMCIACGLCIDACPTETISRDLSTRTAKTKRADLVLTNLPVSVSAAPAEDELRRQMFKRSLAIRVVSTGCSACDLEIGAAGNPIFDWERFGVQVVASPRFADALVVTGPVGKGMQDALLRCYEQMAEPRLVVAAGTCAISGGVHKDGYAEANGLEKILPVDVYIPGCPPHPWSIIWGILVAMQSRQAK